jgi:hypothetical protein
MVKRIPVGILDGDLSEEDGVPVLRMPNDHVFEFKGHLYCIGIDLKEKNRLSGNDVVKTGVCVITVNDKAVCKFEFEDISKGLMLAAYNISLLKTLPFNLSDDDIADQLAGKPLKYKEATGTVETYIPQSGELVLSLESWGHTITTHLLDEDISW